MEIQSESATREPDPRFTTDEAGRVIDATPAGAALLGISVSGLRGRNLLLFFASQRERAYAAANSALWGDVASFEAVLLPRNSRRLKVSVQVSPVATSDGGFQLSWEVMLLPETRRI
jgi:PAS domain-containing protein